LVRLPEQRASVCVRTLSGDLHCEKQTQSFAGEIALRTHARARLHPQWFCYHRGRAGETGTIYFYEEFYHGCSRSSPGSRRNEDIALDLMKFIAMTTSYGKTTGTGSRLSGHRRRRQAEEYAAHLLELYGRCLQSVGAK